MTASTTNQVLNTNPQGPMQQAKIKLPKPQVSSQHPFVNQYNHDNLIMYLRQRLYDGKYGRDQRLNRMVDIDKDVAGWMRLSDEDLRRMRKKHSDGTPQTTEMNLPLTYIHIDDMMTYFAQTFAPTQGMFYQTGKPNEQVDAKQIVTLMNNHAIYAGYYREVLLGIFACLKYNMGGYKVDWVKEQGPKLVRNPNGTDQLTSELRWQGNRLEAIDNYNFFYDRQVHPTKIFCDAEYAAVAKTRSYYWLQNKASQGIFYNCEEALEEYKGLTVWMYYIDPPMRAHFVGDQSGGTDWKAVLSATDPLMQGNGFELVDIYIRLNPTEWGLIPGNAQDRAQRSQYEIWRFTILNDKFIIDATYMNNIHGYLPYFMGLINDDLMTTAQKSVTEILQPLQNFASSLLNTHVKANRKNLWGMTYYDPTMVDLKNIPAGEVSGFIPVNPAAYGRDLRTMIFHDNKILDSKQTLQDLQGVMQIVDQFFPTQSMPNQIAQIDRAIDSQVAAVQQGVNRRQQKSARLLDETIFRPVRFAMYYNIIQYQPDQENMTDYYTGEQITIDLNSLRQTNLPFIIGQGLKAIDRQYVAQQMQKLIFALIQAPQTAQGVDLLGMIDYWTSMIDIDIDMTQFRLQPQQPPGAQPGQPGAPPAAANQPGAAPSGPPIQPITNPAAVTAPIYGRAAGNG